MRLNCSMLVMALAVASRAGAQSASTMTLDAGAGFLPSYSVILNGVQVGGTFPLADPHLRLRMTLGYAWSSNGSAPGGVHGLCMPEGCITPSVRDELLGAELSLQRSFSAGGRGVYLTAGAGLYSSSIRVQLSPTPYTSTMAFGMEGGFGVSGEIAGVELFGQLTLMYLGADRGSPGSSVMLPVMAGIRF